MRCLIYGIKLDIQIKSWILIYLLIHLAQIQKEIVGTDIIHKLKEVMTGKET